MKWFCFILLACLVGCARKTAHSPTKNTTAYDGKADRNSTHSNKPRTPPVANDDEILFPKQWSQTPNPGTTILTNEELRQQADILAAELRDVLETQGTQAMARYLRIRAEQGIRLSPLRELFYQEHHGLPEMVAVSIPPGGEAMVTFANQQLVESGIDFIQFKGVVDKKLTPMDRPNPSDKRLYRDWHLGRETSLPLMGFAVTVLEAGTNASSSELVTSLVRSFVVLGLELQFKIFSSTWNHLFSQNKSMITWRMQTASNKLQQLTDIANHLLDGTRGMTRAYVYSYLVNWGYAVLLYASQFIGTRFLKPRFGFLPFNEVNEFSVIKMVQESWLVNTAYFLAFGLAERALKTSMDRGEMSETLRYQLESVGKLWANFWRVVSFIPGMSKIGQIMLYSFGGVVTLPFVFKTYEAQDYAHETEHVFAANDGDSVPISPVAEAFGDVYDYLPLSRNESLSALLSKLKKQRTTLLNSTKVYIYHQLGY